jgi:hypothetical protein
MRRWRYIAGDSQGFTVANLPRFVTIALEPLWCKVRAKATQYEPVASTTIKVWAGETALFAATRYLLLYYIRAIPSVFSLRRRGEPCAV